MKTEVIVENVVLDVEYDYTPEEAMVYNYGDGSGYPGYPASVDIYNVCIDEADITNILSESALEEIEEQLLNYHSDE